MDEPTPTPIEDEALDWSIRLRGAKGDNALNAELDAWIARSPDHARAWDRVRKSWALMDAVPPAHRAQWVDGPRQGRTIAVAQRRSRRLLPALTALAACALAVVGAPSLLLWARADYSTGMGEMRQVTLADGSTVHLDSGSAIRIDHEAGRRGVTLLAGQAFFDVAHDPQRPFIVHGGDVEVKVLGTAFDVRRDDTALSVAVQRGAVQVNSGHMIQLVLRPGDAAKVIDGTITRSHIPVSRIATWREGQIVVNGATVAEVVAELRRYHRGFVILRNADLARQRVTGAYDVHDPDAALRAVVYPHGGTIRTIGGFVLILS